MMSVEHVNVEERGTQVATEDGQLRCALSGRPLSAQEAYWAPPLVTARELVGTIARTAIQTPSNLSHVLFAEQPDVPYAPEVRAELATRRSNEQLKLLVGLLVVLGLIVAVIVFFALR